MAELRRKRRCPFHMITTTFISITVFTFLLSFGDVKGFALFYVSRWNIGDTKTGIVTEILNNPNRRLTIHSKTARFMMNETQSEVVDDFGSVFYEVGSGNLDTPNIVLDDLNWRVEKLRLEEANKRRFLKSGPRFLPYDECRKWVQAWGRWKNAKEWKEWIEMGEKRNSYIPARPDEYYSKQGKWISWDHFLGIIDPPGK